MRNVFMVLLLCVIIVSCRYSWDSIKSDAQALAAHRHFEYFIDSAIASQEISCNRSIVDTETVYYNSKNQQVEIKYSSDTVGLFKSFRENRYSYVRSKWQQSFTRAEKRHIRRRLRQLNALYQYAVLDLQTIKKYFPKKRSAYETYYYLLYPKQGKGWEEYYSYEDIEFHKHPNADSVRISWFSPYIHYLYCDCIHETAINQKVVKQKKTTDINSKNLKNLEVWEEFKPLVYIPILRGAYFMQGENILVFEWSVPLGKAVKRKPNGKKKE